MSVAAAGSWRVLVLVPALACASGAGSALYRRDVGMASRADALEIAVRVAHQNHYEVASIDSLREVHVQTNWLKRPPFNDETSLGVAEAESRMVIVARPRGETRIGTSYAVSVTLENRLRLDSSSSWSESMNTAMFTAYADRIAADLKQLFTNIGVRRY